VGTWGFPCYCLSAQGFSQHTHTIHSQKPMEAGSGAMRTDRHLGNLRLRKASHQARGWGGVGISSLEEAGLVSLTPAPQKPDSRVEEGTLLFNSAPPPGPLSPATLER
jgi:hypothetical protein